MNEPAPNLESIANGRYEVRGLLGQGGMAAVYLVYDRRLRVECAVKVLAPEFSAKADLRRRFETEASTMARLRHPNIASVFDIGDDNGAPYLVMELISGGSLNDYVEANGPLPPRLAVDVCVSVLTALHVAHESGVIHRDIKPHNVLLARDGTAKVTDFGIARVQSDDSPSMTRTGSIMGTWAYMAPEQRAGSRGLDGRADIYSTGAMLMDLLTGEAPADIFMCEMHTQMLDAVVKPLQPIIQRAVRYLPAERYASATEMISALQQVLPELEPVPRDHPRLGRGEGGVSRFPPVRVGDRSSPPGSVPSSSSSSGSTPKGETYSFDDGPIPPSGGFPAARDGLASTGSSRPAAFSVAPTPREQDSLSSHTQVPDAGRLRQMRGETGGGGPPAVPLGDGPHLSARVPSRLPWIFGGVAGLGMLGALALGVQVWVRPPTPALDGSQVAVASGDVAPVVALVDPALSGSPVPLVPPGAPPGAPDIAALDSVGSSEPPVSGSSADAPVALSKPEVKAVVKAV
ncbi:MAG: serine/threonine protein kinase, partial [Myxococcales bacterium]|nr:serine/threonine protein kinase [Myxococcales bacterium]